MDDMFVGQKSFIVHFGWSKYTCGAGIGIVIISPTCIPTEFAFEVDIMRSNNEVEYEALIPILVSLLYVNAKTTLFRRDSESVIR